MPKEPVDEEARKRVRGPIRLKSGSESSEAAAEPEGADQRAHIVPKEAEPGDAEPDEAEPEKPESKRPATASGNMKAASSTKCKDGHEVGDRWKDDCNDCWCKEGGNIVCTRKLCKKD